MSRNSENVRLGSACSLRSDSVTVDATVSYPNLGIYGRGRGAFRKPPIKGDQTSASTLYRVHAGDFIYSRLFAFEGAYTVVPESLEGSFVSNEFPTFEIDQSVLVPEYLGWYFRQEKVWQELASQAVGVGNRRQRIHPEIVLEHRLRLPSIEDQRAVVGRLKRAESRLSRARTLRQKRQDEAGALLRSVIHPEHCRETARISMSDLVTWRQTDTEVSPSQSYTFAGVKSFGRGVFRKEAKSGMDFAYDRLTRLRAGEFIYPKLMAWEGALGVVPGDCDGCYVSPEFPVFTPDTTKVLPEILDIHFRSPNVWKDLADISTGTNVRRRRLNPKAFLTYEFPLPPMSVQRKVATLARKLKEADTLTREVEKLDQAIMPSLLDRIFNQQDTTGLDR